MESSYFGMWTVWYVGWEIWLNLIEFLDQDSKSQISNLFVLIDTKYIRL